MRISLIAVLLLLMAGSLFAQEVNLVGMHGLRDDRGDLFFEYRGYYIAIYQSEGNIDKDKTIKNIINKNKLGTVVADYGEAIDSTQFRIIETSGSDEDRPNVTSNHAAYLNQKSKNRIECILFQTLNQRDFLLERQLVAAYYNRELDTYIHRGNEALSIDFVGRTIELGDMCRWMSPHNVNCNGGQISWSEFPSYQDAIVDLQSKVLANERPDLKILLDEDIDLLFEGLPTTARRVVYMGASERYPLAVYYIVQEVRGRFVSCTLSNYVYNKNDYRLAPLLQQVIELQDLPEDALSVFDTPVLEESHTFSNYWSRHNIYASSLRVGSMFPLGNTSSLYGFAPSFSLTIGTPIKRDMALDIYISFAFASGRKHFDYHIDERNVLPYAKIDMTANVGVRYRYQKEMARNVYFTPYVGLGAHILETNQIKRYGNGDDTNDEYYSITTLDAMGGVDFRFKKVGMFLEYHYNPYHFSKHGRRAMGNSNLSLGFYYVWW